MAEKVATFLIFVRSFIIRIIPTNLILLEFPMSLIDKYLERKDFSSYEDFVSGYKLKCPDNFNFAYDVVDYYAANEPDRKALVWCDEKEDDKIISFKEMKEMSLQAAKMLSSLGIKKGDRVTLILKQRYEFWFLLLALHRIGAIAIPATHMLSAHDIEYRINSAGIKMIISVSADHLTEYTDEADCKTGNKIMKMTVHGSKEGWLSYEDEMKKHDSSFVRPQGADATTNADTMLLYFTSGTVGLPKMVTHDYTYPLAHILTANYWQNVVEGGIHYTVADTGWAKSVWGQIYGQWLSGSAVFIYNYDRFIAANLLSKATKHGVTTFCAPPTVWRFLVKEDLHKYDFSSFKYCVVAGEPLNPEIYEKFLAATGIKLKEGYGQTEMVVAIATWPWVEPKPGSMGKPSPTYNAILLNREGKECEPGEEGEIVFKTNPAKPIGLFKGYYCDEQLTANAWHDGLYYTGDTAYKDEDGYFWFVGRNDDLIKSSGYRIGPFEVESALIEHPSVLECAVTGIPDDERGQVVKATIVLGKDFTASDELKHELQNHVKKTTAPYKYPRIIEFVESLPKTISGKIRRVAIRDKDKTC